MSPLIHHVEVFPLRLWYSLLAKDLLVVTQTMYVLTYYNPQCLESVSICMPFCGNVKNFGILWFQTIRWCSKNSFENSFTDLASINTDAKFLDCQYTRSSKINYNFTRDDMFTQFLCESGYSGTCRTGTAIQYVNITFGKVLNSFLY